MKRTITAGLATLAAVAGIAFPLPALALTAAEKGDIETVVRDYLIRNPEILVEALDALEAKRAKSDLVAQKAAIARAGADLFSSPRGTVIGNPEGDVTVVEFFDYNCGYCRHAMSDMETLLKEDPKLRFVLKEIPVLGDRSVEASRVSLAFRALAPERYGAFHRKLLGSKGVADENSAITVAEELGVKEPELRQAMRMPEVEAALAENNRLATLLKINGTPSYVISDEVVAGAIGKDGLMEKIANVRRCASASC